LIIRRLIMPLAMVAVTVTASQALAQDASPAAPASAAGECRSGFMPLRGEAEKRGQLIKDASERHASPEEACKLIGNFGEAEVKMIEYVESHAVACGILPQVVDQLKTGHKNTDKMEKKVCAYAQQQAQRPGPSDPVLGPSGPMGDFGTVRGGGGQL
jgi:hypothetical protein